MNPDLASQRGLSGINRVPRKNTTAGTTTAVNIQRHPRCPFQDMRIKAAVAPSETLSAISQLTICAPRMPTTIVSWLIVTSLPRQAAGLTSAMYVGDTFEAMPIATPPIMRKTTNVVKPFAQPVRTEDSAKSTAERRSSFLRPKRSLVQPEIIEPTRHPIRAQLLAQPTCAAEFS